jgi:hypothetical protein
VPEADDATMTQLVEMWLADLEQAGSTTAE